MNIWASVLYTLMGLLIFQGRLTISVPEIAMQLLLLTWSQSNKMVSENWFCLHVIEKSPYVVLPS